MLDKTKGTARDKTLKMLEEHRGEVVSGEKLAGEIGVSRASIWKAIESLRSEGYPITATTNRGYVLAGDSDVLSAQGIVPFLKGNQYSDMESRIFTYKSLESTNKTAKQKAFEGAPSGTTILAEEQTQGRGRLGRSFFSPAAAGLYMSVILRPEFGIDKSLLVTSAASVAVCRAIQETCGVEAQIKWVNDVYVNGRKICGILTEAVTNFEIGAIDSMVVGIGVNCSLKEQDFPPEIRDTAGSLTEVPRNRLAAEILNCFFEIIDSLNKKAVPEYMSEYRARSMVLGRNVYLYKNAGAVPPSSPVMAKAIGITDEGGLTVLYEDGSMETLNSGEISLRISPQQEHR